MFANKVNGWSLNYYYDKFSNFYINFFIIFKFFVTYYKKSSRKKISYTIIRLQQIFYYNPSSDWGLVPNFWLPYSTIASLPLRLRRSCVRRAVCRCRVFLSQVFLGTVYCLWLSERDFLIGIRRVLLLLGGGLEVGS